MTTRFLGVLTTVASCAAILAACGGKVEGTGTSSGGTSSGSTGGSSSGRACNPIGFDCKAGTKPADTDGDGCFDQCVSVACSSIACAKSQVAVDSDGDGCIDSCMPIPTPPNMPNCNPILIDCPMGEAPVDTDGDGCVDACRPTR